MLRIYLCNRVLSLSTSTSKCFETVHFLTVFYETVHLDVIFAVVKDTIKALIPIGQFVCDMLCRETTSETCCTFKCCISGFHAVRAIIIGQLFQIRGFEIVRFVALCLLKFFPKISTSGSQPEKLGKQSMGYAKHSLLNQCTNETIVRAIFAGL